MKGIKESMLLYAVTDRSWIQDKSLAIQVEEAVKAGVTFVQLREKHLKGEALLKEAKEVKAVTDKYHIPFVINDDVELALNIDADGVHVGQSDIGVEHARAILGPDKIIGVTAKTVEQALCAVEQGADYLGVGAFFPTSTKLDAKPISREEFDKIRQAVQVPIVGIGGIDKDNILELKGCGLNGVALVSAIFGQPDIGAATQDLLDKVKQII